MPKTLAPPRNRLRMEPAPNRKRWTRRDCEFLVQNDLLTGRYELIDGDIISTMGQKPPHRLAVVLLRNWLIAVFGARFVQSQATIDLTDLSPDYDEPEPDAAVTAQPNDAYWERHPGPADLLLVAEVSDTTLRFDLRNKALLYARAGIVEYWVVDIAGRRCVAHRQPSADGYREITEYTEDEMVSTLARPEQSARVRELLPPLSKMGKRP